MLDLYPGTTAARGFFGPGEGLPPTAWSDPARVGRQRLSALPPGCQVIVSFKDQHVDRRAFVDAWLAHRPDVDLDLITHHEPEQQDSGDPTRAEYRASWTRTREQVGDHPARKDGRLRLAVCWTLQWIRRGGDWRLWWPEHEADAVDLVLFDWYQYVPTEPNPYRPRFYEDPAAAVAPMTAIAAEVGKAWGVAEVDHTRICKANGYAVDLDVSGELCAAWYRRFHATAKAAGCQVWAHFHRGHGDLTTRPPEQAALRDLIAQEATMPTYAQLQAEPYWGREVVTPAMDWLGDELCRRTGRPREAAGTKGDRYHLRGAHRSQEWILRSVYCTNRSYTVQSGLTAEQLRHVAGFDFTPGSAEEMIAQCKRILTAMKAGELDEIREFYGNVDGDQVVDGWNNVADRAASSDSSHLWHWHLTIDRRHCNDQQLMARILAVALGESVEEEMTPAQFVEILRDPTVAAVMRALPWQYVGGGIPAGYSTLKCLNETLATVKTVGEVIARESSNPAEVRALLAELPQPVPVDVDQLAALVAEGVLAGLPASDGPVSREELEAALRTVLGSLDNVSQG